jgi:DNA primase
MDLFTQIKMGVSVKEAAEYYGLEVNRGSMVCCPFHNDRTPSMKLNEEYFYCFGCGVSGDVIDLAARLFSLTSLQAAKKLADDFGIDPDKPPAAAALRKPKYLLAKAFQKEELHCQRIHRTEKERETAYGR